MSVSSDKIIDAHLKHLELLQAAINRMSANSASSKNYCLTISSAIVGFAFTAHAPKLMAAAFLPILVLYIADASYLALERCYRKRFDQVKSSDWAVMPTFDLSPARDGARWIDCAFSWSVMSFYPVFSLAMSCLLIYFEWSW